MARFEEIGTWARWMLLAVVLAAAPLRAEFLEADNHGYEAPPVLKAPDVLPAEFLKSDTYTVGEEVESAGFFFNFHLDTPSGGYKPDSMNLLIERAHEIDVLSKRTDVDGSAEFAKAFGNKIGDTAKAAGKTVVTPVKTVKAVGNEVEQRSKDVFDFVRRKDRNQPKEPFLVGEEKRKLASKLTLDVYSTNPAVQDYLNSVARARTAGSKLVDVGVAVTTTVIPVAIPAQIAIAAVQYREKMTDKLERLSPTELYRYNDKILKDMDVPSKLREEFLEYGGLTPRQKTEIVADLKTLTELKDRKIFLDIAIDEHAGSGVWQIQSGDLLAKYNKMIETIQEINPAAGPAFAARSTKGTLIVFVPGDILYWNAESEKTFKNYSPSEPAPAPPAVAEVRECVVAGRITAAAKKQIESRGFLVRDNFLKE